MGKNTYRFAIITIYTLCCGTVEKIPTETG